MIIKGNFIYTPSIDNIVIKENEYLLIENNKIVCFFKELPYEYSKENVIDYGQAIIIPAFTDLHIHAPQFINRGIGFDKELLPWLQKYIFPVEKNYVDVEFAEYAYKLFINRLWAVGTMRFSAFATLHKESTLKLMELTEMSGLCAYIGKVNMDRNSPSYLCENTEKSLFETEDLINKCSDFRNVNYIITPRFVPSTTERMMKGLGLLANKYDLPIQSHLSENLDEVAWVRQLHPNIQTYTDVYKEFGLIRKNKTIMAHSIYLSDKEKEILRDENVMIAHCAQSNQNLSSGIMKLRDYIDNGLKCCIASDIAGGHTPNMNKNIASTIELSKVNSIINHSERSLCLPEALFLATKQSGSFFGKVGSFESGYDFDALVIDNNDMNNIFARTPFEKLEQFIYDGDDRNIVVRYCNGRLINKPFEGVF